VADNDVLPGVQVRFIQQLWALPPTR